MTYHNHLDPGRALLNVLNTAMEYFITNMVNRAGREILRKKAVTIITRPLGQRKTLPPTSSLLWDPDKGGNKLLANICILYRSPITQNLGDHEFDLLRSLKVKCHGVMGLPIYGFLLMFNSNIGPNKAPLRDISLQNLGDLEFDLSRSLKVKCEGDSAYMVFY